MAKFRKNKKLLIILIGSILAILGVVNYIEQERFSRAIKELHYLDLVTQVLQSEWECLPNEADSKEKFLVSLIKRFSLDDYEQLETGRAWLREYSKKQKEGSLTIGEREEAKAALTVYGTDGASNLYIYPWSSFLIKASSKTIRIDNCILTRSHQCPTLMSFQLISDYEINIRYEKEGLAWIINYDQWRNLVEKEYRKLSDKDKSTKELQSIVSRNTNLLDEAKTRLSKMKAADATMLDENKKMLQDYMHEKCKTQKNPM